MHAPYPQEQTLTASTDWSPAESTRETIRKVLRKTSVAAYLATEGRYLIWRWLIRWNLNNGFVRFRRNYEGNSHCLPEENNPDTTCWSGYADYVELRTEDWCGCRPAELCTPPRGLPNTCLFSNAHIEKVAATHTPDAFYKLDGGGRCSAISEMPSSSTSSSTSSQNVHERSDKRRRAPMLARGLAARFLFPALLLSAQCSSSREGEPLNSCLPGRRSRSSS